MVVAVRPRGLVAGDAVTGVDSLQEAKLDEGLERAVDGGNADRAPSPKKLVEDLLRAQAAVLVAEQLDHRAPRATAAVTGARQRRKGAPGPGVGLPRHGRYCIFSRVITRIVLVIIPAILLAGCGSTAGKNTVVASFYPLVFAAKSIGGFGYHVDNLTPVGAEPHDLELTPRTVGRVETAGVVLYLGRGFQPAVATAAGQARGEAVDVLAGLPLRRSSEEGVSADPHVWLDPVLFGRMAERIGATLHRSPRALVRRLDALDTAFRKGLRRCARRELVTSHAAFGYLAARYGLRQIAITGLTPEAEPSPRQLARVVQLVRRTGATTIFFERLVSPRLADTVAREVGARTAVLDPIEGLTTAEQARGDDYFSLMLRNLAVLRKALACR
jgi:zinc transport system substrate-binding protein